MQITSDSAGNLHLNGESIFDYGKVQKKVHWFYFYRENGKRHFALGKRGWMPANLAAFFLSGPEVREFMISELSCGIGNLEITVNSWINANENSVSSLLEKTEASAYHRSWGGKAEELIDRYGNNLEKILGHDVEHEIFNELSSSELGRTLADVWRRAYPRPPVYFMDCTNAYYILSHSKTMSDAIDKPKKAYEQMLFWSAGWFENAGFKVDKDEMLVEVEGYQPFYFCEK